jgi:hypothetical protein
VCKIGGTGGLVTNPQAQIMHMRNDTLKGSIPPDPVRQRLSSSSVSTTFDVTSVLIGLLPGFSLGLGLEGELHVYRPASKLESRSTPIERELVRYMVAFTFCVTTNESP